MQSFADDCVECLVLSRFGQLAPRDVLGAVVIVSGTVLMVTAK
jgi:hypothetical protein